MLHIKTLSRRPSMAQQDQTTPAESLVLMLLGIFFRDWDNYGGVSRSLEKFYGKTP